MKALNNLDNIPTIKPVGPASSTRAVFVARDIVGFKDKINAQYARNFAAWQQAQINKQISKK